MSEKAGIAAETATAPAAEPAGTGTWLAVGMTLAAETLLWAALLLGLLTMPAAVALHLAIVATAVRWTVRLKRAGRDLRHAFLLCATTAVLGPAGPAGVAATILLVRWFARSALPFETWYASLFPDETVGANDQLIRRIQSGESGSAEVADLVPFIDILSFGSRDQKQAMLALVVAHFQPAFAPVLRLALRNENGAIRVQAASAMTKVENRFLERAMELARAARQSPDDPVTQLALARHYDGYAFAGILDDKREKDNRGNAVEAYRRYLALRPGDPRVRMELARLLVRKGDYSEAVAILGACIDAGGISTQAAAWYMECLFHLARFDDLRAFSRTHGESLIARSETSAELADAFRLWSAPGAGPSNALPVNAL